MVNPPVKFEAPVISSFIGEAKQFKSDVLIDTEEY